MEIRSLEIDFDRDILKINGEQIKEAPVIVSLPGPEGFKYHKLFNSELATGNPEECNKLDVCYAEFFKKAVNNKP